MSPALPKSPLGTVLIVVVPVAVALAVFFLLAAGPLELSPELLGKADFVATRQLERGWVEDVLPADYLPTLVVETPCRLEDPPAFAGEAFSAFRASDEVALADLASENSGSWLPPLLFSELLLRRGEKARALQVLLNFTRGSRYKYIAENSYLGPDDQRGMIHFWHRFAYLQHETSTRDPKLFWQSLKNPIGRVKILSNSGQSELPKDAPTWDEHRLRAPGCSATKLTSFDLYNNLLVAYLEVPGFEESERKRQVEFTRRYNDRPADNPLLAALQKAKTREIGRREGFVWAISNAERLLRDRAANGRGLPAHSHLALNLALLSSEAVQLVPELRRPFWKLIGELMEQAAGGEVSPEFSRGLTRLRLLRQIESGQGGPVPMPANLGQGGEASGESFAEILARVNAATAARRDVGTTLALLKGDGEPEGLGPAADDWLAALRQDVAAALVAQLPEDASAAERQETSRQARRILGGEAPPPGLEALEDTLPFTTRMAASLRSNTGRFLLATLAAAFVFLLSWWLERELRYRKYLFTHFYRREAEGLRRS